MFGRCAGGEPYKLLRDHFDKLWRTTNVDIFHIESRDRNKDVIGKRIFERRQYWFREVYRGLSNLQEARKNPRQPCADSCQLSVMWKGEKIKGQVRDSSAGGLSLELSEFPAKDRPLKDDRVTVLRPTNQTSLEMPDAFWNTDFVVRWPKREDMTTITSNWNVGLEKAV